MRTAADFNHYYATPDPWHISHANFRDKVLRRRLKPFVRGKSVLEFGGGEGHLTHAVFGKARPIVGIDISDVAIARAKSLNLPSARFESVIFYRRDYVRNGPAIGRGKMPDALRRQEPAFVV